MSEYKVGESYLGKDGLERKIEVIAGEKICYSRPANPDSLWLTKSNSYRLATRIRDEHGNLVELDPPEDKLYPVEVRQNGVVVKMPETHRDGVGLISKHSLSLAYAIGATDGEGRICIGFNEGRLGELCTSPVKWSNGPGYGFYKYAIFRHHTLINQKETP